MLVYPTIDPTIEACGYLAGTDPLAVAYVTASAALAGATLGVAGPQLVAWWQKRKRHHSYWSAIGAELDLCKGLAEAYGPENVQAPLYRLSVIAYDRAFPALLGDGAVSHDDAKAILRFYSQVTQINRGLDRVQVAIDTSAPDDAVERETNRVRKKAADLIDPAGPDPGGPYYAAARAAVDRHLK
jgi:hypothetical protein